MARNRKRKTNIGAFSSDCMKEAVELVVNQGFSIRQAAHQKNLSFQTLARYVRKKRANPEGVVRMSPNYTCRKIMSDEEEAILEDYILTSAKMNYPLTTLDCRRLAYETAVKNNISIPEQWKENRMGGLEWLRNFLKRHPTLSIRQPEGCSLSRATSFNRFNVDSYFDKLEIVLGRNDSFADGSRVWNLDETATTTVQKPKKVVAGKGTKQVSQATSGEKGTLVTTCCFISALGNTIPPAMVFPRTHFKNHMIREAPPGTLGLAAPSGWMNAELFVDVMRHFIKHTCSSKENPTLLLLDNHESHLSVGCLDLAKENGVTLLTFPPHCTHRVQPLDVGVYFSFKSHYNSAVNSWLVNHPGTPLTIYDIASCVKVAFQRSMTPSNITSGFKKTGIFPYDRNIFSYDDFLPSSVTDRSISEMNVAAEAEEATSLSQCSNHSDSQIDNNIKPINESNSTHELATDEGTSHGEKNSNSPCAHIASKDVISWPDTEHRTIVSPHVFRGFPKAQPRKSNPKRKGRSMIATDTPEKDELTEKALKRRPKTKKSTVLPKKSSKRRLFEEIDTCSDSSDDNFEISSGSSVMDDEETFSGFEELIRHPVVGDYVLVEFQGKTTISYYIGEVLNERDTDGDIEISFLRRFKNTEKFVHPGTPDVASVDETDIKMILPKPKLFGKTKRQNNYLSFEIKFGNLNIK